MVSVGMVALVAGCGGGGAVSNSNGTTTYIPPAGGPKTTATLHLLVPGRRPSSGSRSPRYVSAATSRIDVSAVAAGAPSPWPVATSTSVPTPGPVPSGATPSPIPITMTVQASSGSTQFGVNAYDSNGYMLSGVSSTPVPVNVNATNTINLVLNAAANCVQLNNGSDTSINLKPLENQSGAQSATFTVTPCDADGYAIPAGQQLANAIVFSTPAPATISVNSGGRHVLGAGPSPTPVPTNGPATLQFSPSTITAGGATTVTVTYPQHANAPAMAQAVPSPWPTAAYGGFPVISADPEYYILVATDQGASPPITGVFTHDAQNTMGLMSLPYISSGFQGLYPGPIAGDSSMHGCAQGGQAILPASGYLNTITIPLPPAADSTPGPLSASGATSYGGGNPTAIGMDQACGAYIGESGGYLYYAPALSAASPFGGPFSPPNMPGYALPISAVAVSGMPYVGLNRSAGYMSNIQTSSGKDTNVGETTMAMAHINATDLAIAYSPYDSDLRLGTWTPPNGTLTTSVALPGTAVYSINGIAVDPSGNIWAVESNGTLWEYTPSTGSVASYRLANNSPVGIAIAPDGMIFIVDNVSNSLDMYSSLHIGGPTPPQLTNNGVPAVVQQSVPINAGATGVTIVP